VESVGERELGVGKKEEAKKRLVTTNWRQQSTQAQHQQSREHSKAESTAKQSKRR
jgi:heme-degrading monooxygenase HmoA